ncbi:MAG TPA: lysophospholipid acyltransferase family protein, partial [Polyangiaceae bacterium]
MNETSTASLVRDVREGSRWTPGQRAKNALIYAGLRAALFFAERLAETDLRAFGRFVGEAAHVLARRERETARANVARVFPALDEGARNALVHANFTKLGDDLAAAVHAMTRGGFAPLPLAAEDACILQSALDEGRGVVFVSAHLGPWEQVAATMVARGFPLTTIARESYDPRLTTLYDRLRGRHGVRAIYRGAPGASLKAMRHLKAGKMLGIVMDLASRVPSVPVPFLGHEAPTAVGPARLALRSGARVVVATAAPTPNGEVGVTIEAIETRDLSSGLEGEVELTQRLNDALSRRIRALPERWIWMHPRW